MSSNPSCPELKKAKPELNGFYSKVLQMALYQLYSNLKDLSRLKKNNKRVGRIRFKGKGWYKTFIYNQSGFKLIETGKRLDLSHPSKIGDIPIRVHRPIKGRIKHVIVKRHKTIDIDVGIKHFLTDSDGRQIENPRFYERTLERIRVLHRNLSRKEKSSKKREKARIKLTKAYKRLINLETTTINSQGST